MASQGGACPPNRPGASLPSVHIATPVKGVKDFLTLVMHSSVISALGKPHGGPWRRAQLRLTGTQSAIASESGGEGPHLPCGAHKQPDKESSALTSRPLSQQGLQKRVGSPALLHLAEDVLAGRARLLQRLCQDLQGDALHLAQEAAGGLGKSCRLRSVQVAAARSLC